MFANNIEQSLCDRIKSRGEIGRQIANGCNAMCDLADSGEVKINNATIGDTVATFECEIPDNDKAPTFKVIVNYIAGGVQIEYAVKGVIFMVASGGRLSFGKNGVYDHTNGEWLAYF